MLLPLLTKINQPYLEPSLLPFPRWLFVHAVEKQSLLQSKQYHAAGGQSGQVSVKFFEGKYLVKDKAYMRQSLMSLNPQSSPSSILDMNTYKSVHKEERLYCGSSNTQSLYILSYIACWENSTPNPHKLFSDHPVQSCKSGQCLSNVCNCPKENHRVREEYYCIASFCSKSPSQLNEAKTARKLNIMASMLVLVLILK